MGTPPRRVIQVTVPTRPEMNEAPKTPADRWRFYTTLLYAALLVSGHRDEPRVDRSVVRILRGQSNR